MAEHLRVIARFVARPEKVDELKALLQGLIEPTHAEEGCVMYTLWRNKENPLEFTFVEEWTSEAALEAHLATPHLKDALPKLDDLLAEPLFLGKYDVVG